MDAHPSLAGSGSRAPSALQIRYGGFKGVVAVWQDEVMQGAALLLRPSMRKFECAHTSFEVRSPSLTFSPPISPARLQTSVCAQQL